jgi:hypothetical protein
MRSVIEERDWRPIEEAPLEEPVDVLVTDHYGSVIGCSTLAGEHVKDGSPRAERPSP